MHYAGFLAAIGKWFPTSLPCDDLVSLLPCFPDSTAVWERVQQQAVRCGAQQISWLCLRWHLGHRQDTAEGHGDIACQQPAPTDPGLQLHRSHTGQDHPQRHEWDQLLRGHGQCLPSGCGVLFVWCSLWRALCGALWICLGKRDHVTHPLILNLFSQIIETISHRLQSYWNECQGKETVSGTLKKMFLLHHR